MSTVLLLDTVDVEVVVLPLVMEETTFDVDELSPMMKEFTVTPDSTSTCGNSMLLGFEGDNITIGSSEVPACKLL